MKEDFKSISFTKEFYSNEVRASVRKTEGKSPLEDLGIDGK
jgi:hypothetical protein